MFKRLLSLALAFLLVLSLAPIGAIAADVPATEEPTVPATEEPTVPATEEPTVPATEEPTVPVTESPSQKDAIIRSAGRPERNAAPVTGTVEFSMSVSGVDSDTLPSVSLLLTHEDGVTTHTVTLTNDYGSGWDAYTLPVGNYTVSLSGFSLDGYELDLYLPTSLQVAEEDYNYYDFSITAYKRNGSVSVKVSFAESSDLQAKDFPNGISLTVDNNIVANYNATLNSENNWSYDIHGFTTPAYAYIRLNLPFISGYTLSVSDRSYSTNCEPDYEASHDTYDPISIESAIRFEDGGSYTMDLVLDFQKYDTGSVELSLNVSADTDLPEGQPAPASICIYDESYELRYEGYFTGDKITIPSLPVGTYYLDLYQNDVGGYTSDTTYPRSFTVTSNAVTKLDLFVVYTAIKYGSVLVKFVTEADKPIPEDQLLFYKDISIFGTIDSFSDTTNSDSITFDRVPAGQYSVNFSEPEMNGYNIVAEVPEEITVTEGSTAELIVTIKCTAIKYGSAKLQFKATGDISQEELPSSIRGMFHDGYLDGGIDVEKYNVDLISENNWIGTVDNLPEGDYLFSLYDIDVEGYLVTDIIKSSEFVTVTEGTTAEAVCTVEYASASRFGDVDIHVQLENPSVAPEGAYLTLADSQGAEHTVWLWFDEDGHYYESFYNLPAGEYSVRTAGCDVYGSNVTVTAPSTITVEGGKTADLNISISYESVGTGNLRYTLCFVSPSLGGELSEEQMNILWGSLSVTATDAFGRETVLEKDEGSSDFDYSADALPSGTYSIRIDGYDLAGHESRFSRCDTNITVVSGQHTGGVANICYFTRESTFSTKVCFAEGSVLNETNFPEGIEFWIYGEALTEPVSGTLGGDAGWSLSFDSLPSKEKITFELKSPALDNYVLHSVNVSVDFENCTQWNRTNSKELPFVLKHIIQFYDQGSYDVVITLDIREKPEPETPKEELIPFRFDLLPTLPPLMELDNLPGDISIRLKAKYGGAEYTAAFEEVDIGRAPFAAQLKVPEGWYYISLENYELDGYAAFVSGCIDEIYLSDTGSTTKTVNLRYGYGNGKVKLNLAFAEGSALNADNFPGIAHITFDPYTELYFYDNFSKENNWSITYDNLFNAFEPYSDDFTDTTPYHWDFFVNGIPGYGLRNIQVVDSGENFDRNYVDISSDLYSASGSYELWKDGTCEITFILDFVKEDGSLTLRHEFSPDSALQAEDFPNGIKINLYSLGNFSVIPDSSVTLGPGNDWSHTLTGISYGNYRFEIADESVPEFYSHNVSGNDSGIFSYATVSGPEPVTHIFKSRFISTLGNVQVNVSFAPGSSLSKYNFDGSVSLMIGEEEFVLNRSNNFFQTKALTEGDHIVSPPSIDQTDGYVLNSLSYNGAAYSEDSNSPYRRFSVYAGKTTVLNLVLDYEETSSNTLVVTENFYKETTASALSSSSIKVYLEDTQGNILQKGILNESNCWSYTFDIPEKEGDYVVRQVHDVPDHVAVYSDYNKKTVHLTPQENASVRFKSDYRVTYTGPISLEFTNDTVLDWIDFPDGYVLVLTDTTGRFTVKADVVDGFGMWGDGVLTVPAGTYEGFTLLNADKEGYLRTTEFWYGYREPGGASLRDTAPRETMLYGPMTLDRSEQWYFRLRNHYTRFGSLTVTNEETFAYFGGSQLPGSLNSGLESQSYTYEVTLDGETETFTLKPGEEKTFSYLPNGTEYCVNVIAADGIAWNMPVSIDEGQIEGVSNEDATYNYTVHKLHDYLYLLDDDGVSAHFVKTDSDGDPLSGAKFGIYSDEDCTELVEYVSSGKDGIVTLRFDEVGTWYIKEVKAPRGYRLSDKVITAEVTHSWATQTRTDASGKNVIVIAETLDVDIDGLTAKDGVSRFENVPGSGSSGNSMTPATGDPFDPVYCVFLLMLSAALILLMRKRRKHA